MAKKKNNNDSAKSENNKDDESTKIVSKFLLKNCTILSSLLEKQDFVNEAISTILSSRSNRQSSYDVMTDFLPSLVSTSSTSKSNNMNNLNTNLKKLYPIIDKFASLLESVQIIEVNSFLNFVSAFVIDTSYTSDIMTYWNKNINKIVQTIIRILKKFSTSSSLSSLPDSYLFFVSIEVLTIFYKSKLRSIMSQFSKQIRDLIIPFFTSYKYKDDNSLESNQFSLISELFVNISSTESSDIWLLTLQWVSANMAIVLNEFTNSSSINSIVKEIYSSKVLELSVSTSTNAANINKLKQSLTISIILDSLQGTDKAMASLTIFNQLAFTLNRLLVYGNSSGYVNLDVSIFISLMMSLLPISVNVDINDPANFIENENNFSKIDSSMVITEAKISTLHCLSTILSLHSPLMIQYGQQIIQPVFSLLNKVNSPYNECEYVPRLLVSALECIQAALPSIPSSCSTLLNMIKNGGGLLQLFTQQVAAVCYSRSGVSDVSLEKSNVLFHKYGVLKQSNELYIEHENDEITKLIFNTIELLLIHTGTLLSHSILLSIHDGIKLLLSTMSKGLTVSPLPFDFKRLKRLQCERIRSSPRIIIATLTLALAECLIYPNINKNSTSKTSNSSTNIKGTHSDNIYLLQKICRASSSLPYTQSISFYSYSPLVSSNSSYELNHNIVSESTRILHIVGQFINPIAYVIPPINVDIISKHFHNRLKDVGYSASSIKISQGLKRNFSDTNNINVPAPLSNIEISEVQNLPENKISKIEPEKQENEELNSNLSSAGLKPLSFRETSISSKQTITEPIPTEKVEENEEDDELPDIDMGSESD